MLRVAIFVGSCVCGPGGLILLMAEGGGGGNLAYSPDKMRRI